jgi:hypothetical protein
MFLAMCKFIGFMLGSAQFAHSVSAGVFGVELVKSGGVMKKIAIKTI